MRREGGKEGGMLWLDLVPLVQQICAIFVLFTYVQYKHEIWYN